MRHVMAIASDELFARVKASAARAKRTVQGHIECLLEEALNREETPPVIPKRPPVSTGEKATPVCRRCEHEERKHSPACVMMACPCRKFI